MTIKTIIHCDAFDCRNTLEVDECDSVEVAMRYSGWKENPYNGYEQFCDTCWPEVEKDLEEANAV